MDRKLTWQDGHGARHDHHADADGHHEAPQRRAQQSSLSHMQATMKAQEAKDDAPKVYDRWSDQPKVVVVIAVAIILNGVQMGMELQFQGGIWKMLWMGFENFFTVFFLGEMIAKMIADKPMVRDYFSHRANKLDFVIVVSAVIDNWILIIFMTEEEKDKLSFLSVMKLVRLGRILKLLRMKRELELLVGSIVSSLGAMMWLSVLLFIMIYTLAICCVQFIGRTDIYPVDEFDNKKFFGDMVASSVTGLNLAILDGFGDVFRPVLKYQPHLCLGIGVYVGIASFGIMNAIIGVIVTKTSEAADELEKDNEAVFRKGQMEFVSSISEMIYEIDIDGDGTVSPEEIEKASDNEQLLAALDEIDLPFNFSLSDLHCMLDKDGDGELTKLEFFVGMQRMIFANDFHRSVLLGLSIAQTKRKMFEMRNEMSEEFEKVHAKLDKLLDNAGKSPPYLPQSLRPMTAPEKGMPSRPGTSEMFAPRPGANFSKQSTRMSESFGFEGERFQHLVQVEERILEKTVALHQKFDELKGDDMLKGGALAIRPDGFASAFSDASQFDEMSAGLSEQLMTMDRKFEVINQNIQWMRGAIQTNAQSTSAPVSGGFQRPTGKGKGKEKSGKGKGKGDKGKGKGKDKTEAEPKGKGKGKGKDEGKGKGTGKDKGKDEGKGKSKGKSQDSSKGKGKQSKGYDSWGSSYGQDRKGSKGGGYSSGSYGRNDDWGASSYGKGSYGRDDGRAQNEEVLGEAVTEPWTNPDWARDEDPAVFTNENPPFSLDHPRPKEDDDSDPEWDRRRGFEEFEV